MERDPARISTDEPPPRARLRALPLLLFTLSGASGLMIEVLWRERLGQVFGATAQATAATLAAFFLGLGVGAWFWGRRAPSTRRPLAAYGLLELAAAVSGLLYFVVLPVHGSLYGTLVGEAGTATTSMTLVRVLLALLFLAPPAFFLGGTFPMVAEALVRPRGDLGRQGALLYALNTLGAAGGVVLAAFVLPPRWGFAASYLTALVLAAAIGLVAILLAWARGGELTTPPGPPPPPPIPTPEPSASPRLPVGLALASGFLAMGAEVAWMRMFAQAMPNSVYVFAVVLAVFLLALMAGGFAARWLAGRPWEAAAVLVVLLGLSALLVAASGHAFVWATDGLRPPPPGLAWHAYLRRTALTALAIVGLPTVVLGAVFPYLLRVARRSPGSPGGIVGRLAAWNTAGAVLGPLAAAFVLFPLAGLWRTVALVSLAYALLAFLIARRTGGRRSRVGAAAIVVLAAAGLAGTGLPTVRLGADERLVEVWEGASGIVTVVDAPTSRKLVHNNVFTLGGTHDVRWEAMQAHIPLLIHPDPQEVFFLGLGTGSTAGGAMDHPVRSVVVAELVGEVVDAARTHFGDVTNGLFEDDRARVLTADARHHLRWTESSYDVIVGDLFFPWEPGTANLYTREHFEAVRARLRPGGLFAQWLPCYQLSPEEFRGIARTMVETFPQVTLWRGDFFAQRPILALVGHERPFRIDAARMEARARRLLGGDGALLARDAAAVPLHLYAGNLGEGSGLLADARPVTDDDPWIAYSAPKSERGAVRGGARRFVGEALLAFEQALAAEVPVAADPCLDDLTDEERAAVEGGRLFRRMAVALAAFRQVEYARLRLDYRRLVPPSRQAPVDAWVE